MTGMFISHSPLPKAQGSLCLNDRGFPYVYHWEYSQAYKSTTLCLELIVLVALRAALANIT